MSSSVEAWSSFGGLSIEIMQGTQAGSKAVFNPNLNERSIASTKAVDDSVARSDSSRNVVNTHNVL